MSHIDNGHVAGFEAPIHASLGQAILLGGAPRGIAIVNGTIAAAIGLGLQQWLVGIALWAVGYPGRSAALLVVWVSIAAIMKGITDMGMGFQIRRLGKEVA